MAPSRTNQQSTSVAGPSKGGSHREYRSNPYSNSNKSTHGDALPGVQKLKSALRQSKRLLAKDRLAADVRVETERRTKALEADLARAERSRKERQYATKYHKVKFFERKKVIRKIKQVKRSIATSQAKEELDKLESDLVDLRVDLNYVLHFPKTKKYVSLFPPEVRGSGSTTELVAAPSDDNEERSKVREIIRQQMEVGELSNEPENELGKPGQRSAPGRRAVDVPPSIKARTHVSDFASDDFFGEEEENQESDL